MKIFGHAFGASPPPAPKPPEEPPSLYLDRFQPSQSTGRNNVVTLARLAVISYVSPTRQKEIADQQKGVVSFQVLDSQDNESFGCHAPDTGTQVTVLETDTALLVSPRGTPLELSSDPGKKLQADDILNDLNGFPTQNYSHTALVHRGFKRATDGIWEQLKPILEEAQAHHKEIHLSGHSLGAAIATHIADRMVNEMHQLPRSLVTLGGPAVGWKGERQHLQEIGLAERTTRLVNNLDPVPHGIPFGKQFGKEIYFDAEGQARVNPEHTAREEWKGLGSALRHFQLNPLQSHYPKLYLDHLQDPQNAKALS